MRDSSLNVVMSVVIRSPAELRRSDDSFYRHVGIRSLSLLIGLNDQHMDRGAPIQQAK